MKVYTPIWKVTVLITIFSILPISTFAGVSFNDDWTSSFSTTSDGVAWGGYNLNAVATSVASSADCLCWDWCDAGGDDNTVTPWDNCYCESSTVQGHCQTFSPIIVDVICDAGKCDIQTNLEQNQPQDTGSSGTRGSCLVDIREYKDCNNSSGQAGIVNHQNNAHYEIYPKFSQCDGTTYDTEGNTDVSAYVIWDDDRSCGTFRRCDTNSGHTNHDNEEVFTATGNILSPCNKRDGTTIEYDCNSSSQCYSGSCGQDDTWTITCTSDGSNSYSRHLDNMNPSCGGQGYLQGTSDDIPLCSDFLGSDYVCDSDLDGVFVDTLDITNFCMIKEYSSCTTDSQCWNDNNGYDCMGTSGTKICTTGTNDKTCTNNDDQQCDSGRCDSTCLSKLSDGQSCDEQSDCTNSNCNGDTCGGTSACDNDYNCEGSETPASCPNDCKNSGSSCLFSKQCYDVDYCVHNQCRNNNPYCGDTFCDSGEACSSCSGDCGICAGPEIRINPITLDYVI